MIDRPHLARCVGGSARPLTGLHARLHEAGRSHFDWSAEHFQPSPGIALELFLPSQ